MYLFPFIFVLCIITVLVYLSRIRFVHKTQVKLRGHALNPRSLMRGDQLDPPPLDFFGFKFLLLDRLSKALA